MENIYHAGGYLLRKGGDDIMKFGIGDSDLLDYELCFYLTKPNQIQAIYSRFTKTWGQDREIGRERDCTARNVEDLM